MREENASRGAALAALAAAQHGIVGYSQLIGLGFSRGMIDRYVRAGRLHRLHKGVYAVGHPGVSILGRRMAAVLACGPNATLSHWSAAAHWDLLQTNRTVIDVVAPGNRLGPKGIHVHRGTLWPDEWTRRDGIRVTTVPRTLLDLAAVGNHRQLRRATNQAVRLGWLNPKVVNQLTERHRGRAGIRAFKAVTAAVNPQTHRTRSDLEDDFLALCHRHPHWPRAISNAEIKEIEVDIHFESTKLIVELDHYDYHRTPQEFDNDRRRDAYLKTRGFEVLRVSDEWLNSDPAGVASTVDQLLAAMR